MKPLRKVSIPVAALTILAVNTSSQVQLSENLWAAWVGAALIVLAGLLSVGKKWMYFVFPIGVAILIFLTSLGCDYLRAADYLGHRPEGNELAAFINTKWQSEYGAQGPYFLALDGLYFLTSYIGGWLYGTWSMLAPGAVETAAYVAPPSKVTEIRQPFKIMLWVLITAIVLSMLLGRSR